MKQFMGFNWFRILSQKKKKKKGLELHLYNILGAILEVWERIQNQLLKNKNKRI